MGCGRHWCRSKARRRVRVDGSVCGELLWKRNEACFSSPTLFDATVNRCFGGNGNFFAEIY
eukprot:410522-Prymnesium_polylepis.1